MYRFHYETLSNFLRALLDGERGIQASKWSMSVKTRSSTFTFADLLGQYREAIRGILSDLDSNCDVLKTKSLEAYASARGEAHAGGARPATGDEGKSVDGH